MSNQNSDDESTGPQPEARAAGDGIVLAGRGVGRHLLLQEVPDVVLHDCLPRIDSLLLLDQATHRALPGQPDADGQARARAKDFNEVLLNIEL